MSDQAPQAPSNVVTFRSRAQRAADAIAERVREFIPSRLRRDIDSGFAPIRKHRRPSLLGSFDE
jgi:hypothetical protein